MTTQDLKNNRNEIIERIKEIGNESMIKEIMTGMVRVIEAEMNETDDCIELVDEVVEMNPTWKKKEENVFHKIEEANRIGAMNQRPSSMR